MQSQSTSLLPKFLEYVFAFEAAVLTDEWGGVAQCFTEDARHLVDGPDPLASDVTGNAAIGEAFRRNLAGLDRRFDQRIPEVLEGPFQDGSSVWMRWALVFRRHGLPPLRIEGDHTVTYEGGRISSLVENVAADTGARVANYLERYDELLLPEGGSEAAAADEAGLIAGADALQRTLISFYGSAKSRADVAGALAVCTEDFSIETVPLGVKSTSREHTARDLEVFFAAFPDYSVTIDGVTSDADVSSCWGQVRMTPVGEILGTETNGRTADLPYFCVFTFEGGLLASERFFFDLATLCRQTGMDQDAVFAAAQAASRATESRAA